MIYSLALGTGLRLAEIVGLNVGDVYSLDGAPRTRTKVYRVRECGKNKVPRPLEN